MPWRRILLVLFIVVLPVFALAPLWMLPTPGDGTNRSSDAASLEAWSRQLRTGEQLPVADRAMRLGHETTVGKVVYRVLGDTDHCTGIRVDPLGERARQLPGAACRP